MNQTTAFFKAFAISAFLLPAGLAQTPDPQTALSQAVAELQKSPADSAVREKIIKLAAEMNPAPAVPPEVDELFGQATYIFKNAQGSADFAEAVRIYQKILLIVPWVADHYFNLGTMQEKAGQLGDAAGSFRLYLLAAPNAENAKAVRERIGVLKYQAQKTAEQATAAAEQERQAAEQRRMQQQRQAEADRRRQEEAAVADRRRQEEQTAAERARQAVERQRQEENAKVAGWWLEFSSNNWKREMGSGR